MEKDLIRIVRLTEDYEIKPFDCGNDDLNDFLLNDALQPDAETFQLYFDMAQLDS